MTSIDTRPRATAATTLSTLGLGRRTCANDGTDEISLALGRFFDDHERLAARHGAAFSALWAQIRRATEGGKKFRPDLVVTTHRELGGDHPAAAVSAAVAFEVLHTAFLLHDDVIDGDTVRRGHANLIGSWSGAAQSDGLPVAAATAWGQAAGILAGDLLLHCAQGFLARMDIEATQREAVLDTFDDAVMTTASGELDDVGLSVEAEPATMAAVLSMTARKTARYSFQAPLRAGAILAGAGDAVLSALERYGEHAGIAFQLRDDLLGVFGDVGTTGKSASSDLRRATMTPLVAHVLQTSYRDEFLGLLRAGCTGPTDVDRARHIMIEAGARDFVEQLIAEHVGDALGAAHSVDVPPVLGNYLATVARAAGRRAS